MRDRDALVADNTAAAASTTRPKLKVGVLLRGFEVPAWQLLVLSRVGTSAYGEIVVAIDEGGAVTPHTSVLTPPPRALGAVGAALSAALVRVITRLEAKMVCDDDAFARLDVEPMLRGATIIRTASGGATIDTAALREFDVDVFIDFAGSELAVTAAGAAPHGVWRLRHPYSAEDGAGAAGFWPVYHGWPVAESVIEALDGDGQRSVVARAFPATNPYSIRLNASSMHWRIASLLPQQLRKLHASVAPQVDGARHEARESRVDGPSATELLMHIARNVTRRARASVARRCMDEQWILLARFGEELSTSPAEFRKIVPPKDRFWADPHLVRRDGRYYAFVEECPFATGKGHIAVLTIDEDGTHGEPVTVLERDYHLSYPFVFEHAGELYMVPESEANRTIDLYRCVGFPEKWELVRTLIDGVTATDSTLVYRDGTWWLFANVLDTAGASFSEELSLFHSPSLFDGEWQPHQANPIISDARRARPAGAIIERHGRLYRPAQDCSVRYGYGIRIHEIETLSEHEYREREIDTIFPTWDSRIVATHTLSYTPGLTVIDALQPRLRF